MPQELTKAERKALFEQQNKAKIEAAKAAKEQEKLSKKAESAAVAVRNSAYKIHYVATGFQRFYACVCVV